MQELNWTKRSFSTDIRSWIYKRSKTKDSAQAYDVIFSVIAGLPKVYPNFVDVPHNVLQ